MSDPSIELTAAPRAAAALPRRSILERGYGSILVHVQPDAPGRVACAQALAQRFDARLIGIGAEAVQPIAVGPATGLAQAGWTAVTGEAIQRSLNQAHELFDRGPEGVEQIWEQAMEMPADLIARVARAADLIVASRAPPPRSLFRDADPGELALTAGRPVLFAPEGAKPLRAERVVVAWKECREARRALFDAMPILCSASEVLVLAVNSDEGAEARQGVQDVGAALTRRGVRATNLVAPVHGAEGEEILRLAKRFGADVIVAGAYGAPRLQEWIFGGVTRALLAQDEVHVLFSH